MRRTLDTVRRQGTTAEGAAGAALMNAQAVVDAERPWMRVEPKYEKDGDYPRYTFNCVNRGKSPAIIVNQSAAFRPVSIEAENDLPAETKYGQFAAPEWEIVHHLWFIPDESFEVYQFDPRIIGENDPERWNSIAAWKMRLYFVGAVRYRDTLSQEIHESRFCYVAAPGSLRTFGPTSAYNKLA